MILSEVQEDALNKWKDIFLSSGEQVQAWRIPLLDIIPVTGSALKKDWVGSREGTMKAPGRNHPGVGAWLEQCWLKEFPGPVNVADPMIGVGGLWLQRDKKNRLYGCDVEPDLISLAVRNVGPAELFIQSARYWTPQRAMQLVMFSPPFPQSHSSGKTQHQKDILKKKNLWAVQEFGKSSDNLGSMKGIFFWTGMEAIYKKIWTYLQPVKGRMVVILRNHVRKGVEVDHIGRHIEAMRRAGFEVLGAHPRALGRPTGYQQWKVSRDPTTPWIKLEWAISSKVE